MDAGKLKRVGGRDEEPRAAFHGLYCGGARR
jgi:hypothetical protein